MSRRLRNLSVIAVLLTGCTTFEGNRGIVPFFEVFETSGEPYETAVTPTPVRPSRDDPPEPPLVAAFFPFIEPHAPQLNRPPGREVALRPLGSIAEAGPDSHRLLVLWPILDYQWGGGERRGWILPFWFRHQRPDTEGVATDRWTIFPFFFGGRLAAGRYFAILPLGGKIRGLLAQQEINFWLFPAYWHHRTGEYNSVHVVFPFYNRTWGMGRTGWRIWPFFGRYRFTAPDGRERYDRFFVLWPFYHYQRNELNTLHPGRLFFIFPFYGEYESDKTFTRTILWPLFHSTLDKPTGRKSYFGWVIPYRFAEGQFDLWPLFGLLRTDTAERPGAAGARAPGPRLVGSGAAGTVRRHRHFFLWPIERYDYSEDEEHITSRFWILPLFWRFRDASKVSGAEDFEWKLWPLARYHRTVKERTFYFPSPLWFRQEAPWERLYARLWRLFLWREDEKARGWEALFSLVSYRHENAGDRRTFRVLGGLFQRSVAPERSSYRFFYLPWE